MIVGTDARYLSAKLLSLLVVLQLQFTRSIVQVTADLQLLGLLLLIFAE